MHVAVTLEIQVSRRQTDAALKVAHALSDQCKEWEVACIRWEQISKDCSKTRQDSIDVATDCLNKK